MRQALLGVWAVIGMTTVGRWAVGQSPAPAASPPTTSSASSDAAAGTGARSFKHAEYARTLADQGKWQEAEAELAEAMRIDPANNVSYYLLRSEINRRQGDYDDAVRDANFVLALRPETAEAYMMRSFVWSKRGLHKLLIDDITKTLALKPDFTGGYMLRANAYAALGEHARSLADFDEAIRRNPRDALIVWARGSAHNKLGRHADAAADYDAAVRLDPKNAEIALAVAGFYVTCPDPTIRNGDKALDYVCGAQAALGKADWKILAAAADAYAESGDFVGAAGMATHAIEAAPTAEQGWLRDRLALFQAGRPYRPAVR